MLRLESGCLQSSGVSLLRTPVRLLDLSVGLSDECSKNLRKEYFSLLGILGKEGFHRKNLPWFPYLLFPVCSSVFLWSVPGHFMYSFEILFCSFVLNKRCNLAAFFSLLCMPCSRWRGPLVSDSMLN